MAAAGEHLHEPGDDGVQQRVQLVVGRRIRLDEGRRAIGAAAVHPVRHQTVQVDVEVGGRSEALDQRDGAGLPDWIAGFEPASAPPYLGDVARLEWARLCAFHAADAEGVEPRLLSALLQSPERLAQAALALHPSLAVVRSPHPVVSLWGAHQRSDADRDAQLAGLDIGRAEAALVLRDPADDALVLPLDLSDAELAAAISAGAPLGAAHAAHPRADLVHVLTLLLQHGLVTGVGDPRSASETHP